MKIRSAFSSKWARGLELHASTDRVLALLAHGR
jgi:hypothetical protein